MSTIIRPYQPADAPALLELFKITIRRVNARDYGPEQIAAWASDEIDLGLWTERFAGRYAFVAESNHLGSPQLAGFADLEANGHLDRFYVAANCQRQGVGRALLQAILQAAQEHGIQRIFTEASITARPFFIAHGFREIAEQTVVHRGVPFVNYRLELLA